MYKIEIGRPFYFPLRVLRCLHVIPRNLEKSYLKNYWIKRMALTMLCAIISIVWPMLHLIMSLKDNTGVNIAVDLSVCLGLFSCLYSAFRLSVKYKKWSEYFAEVADFKKLNSLFNAEKVVSDARRFSSLYFCYVLCGVTLYGLLGLSESSYCKQLNKEKGLHEACFLLLPIWLPFDVNDIFTSVTIFTIQTLNSVLVLSASAMTYFLILESAEILILHMDSLKEDFISLFGDTSHEKVYAKLQSCINYHNQILRLGNDFNSLQKYTVGHISFIAAIILGCILNQTAQNIKPIGAAVYLIFYLTSVGLVCHAGQRIADQTSSVGDAVYASNWVKADPQTKKDLALVILRCQKPIYLNCRGIGIHNYALFITILKASYSYLTLLNEST